MSNYLKQENSDYLLQETSDKIVLTTGTSEWEGQSSLEPSRSTVYLQIFNHDSSAWETIDSNSSAPVDTNFELSGKIPDLTDYVTSGLITCRVYQFATE